VCFNYSNGVPILKNISFTVPPGKKVAIVGASGAGSVHKRDAHSRSEQEPPAGIVRSPHLHRVFCLSLCLSVNPRSLVFCIVSTT
jgi:ABC-type dipeptide/oligopeptide/nickel transport system ATPase component